MSIISAAGIRSADASPRGRGGAGDPQPRVRHLAREAMVLMVFSASSSVAFAGCLLLLTSLGRQG